MRSAREWFPRAFPRLPSRRHRPWTTRTTKYAALRICLPKNYQICAITVFMVDSIRHQRLNLPVAPFVAVVIGGIVALVFAIIPAGSLEQLMIDSGIAAIIPATQPPLGVTARAVLILAAGAGSALVAWFALFLLIGGRAIVVQNTGAVGDDEAAPVLRRADAHPDAPARRPLSATRELGTPFLEVRANRPTENNGEMPAIAPEQPALARDLPADLDTPLAAFDPSAIPAKPIDWSPPTAEVAAQPDRPAAGGGAREPADLPPLEPKPIGPKPMGAPVTAESESYAPTPIAAPEPTPAFAPPSDRTGEAPPLSEPPLFVPPSVLPSMPLSTPDASPEPAEPIVREPIAPTPAPPQVRPPGQIFRARPHPFRTELAEEVERPFAPSRPPASARVEKDLSVGIHALLDRLERTIGRRETVAPPPSPQEESLQETLGTLRHLATRR